MAMSEKHRLIIMDHLRAENAHDVDATIETFGPNPFLVVNGQRIAGNEGVRSFYDNFLLNIPDARFDLKHLHIGQEAIVGEFVVVGTHRIGRPVELPISVTYIFDEGKLAGERLYFNEALMPQ